MTMETYGRDLATLLGVAAALFWGLGLIVGWACCRMAAISDRGEGQSPSAEHLGNHDGRQASLEFFMDPIPTESPLDSLVYKGRRDEV